MVILTRLLMVFFYKPVFQTNAVVGFTQTIIVNVVLMTDRVIFSQFYFVFFSFLFSANPQEDTLYQLPDRLRLAETKRSEDMLSNQMLSGIPEVDLGIQ